AIYTNIDNGAGGFFIMCADFNNDGYDDLACANENQKKVTILYGAGAPSFTNIVTYTFNSRPTCIKYHDVDNDGKKDFIIGSKSMDTIYVMKGDGIGGYSLINKFRPNQSALPIFISSIDLGDVDHDGKEDIIINEWSQDSILIYLGCGNGQFNYNYSLKTGTFANQIILEDMNNDGNCDITSFNSSSFYNFKGNGIGGFDPPTIYPPLISLGQKANASITDFNLDGILDIAMTGDVADSSAIYLGNVNGNFTNSLYLKFNATPGFVMSADFNNDGKPDLVYALGLNDSISVLLNKTVVESLVTEKLNRQLKLYPIPVHHQLNIDCDIPFSGIQLYTLFNQLVLEEKFENAKHAKMDLSNLAAGFYFLKVDQYYSNQFIFKNQE
ncbi:MAG TPA: FG-GAP-like repeat-containing protein, partial [Chitinophagaceae bacterium]|nr:FG-GAP-like repeat-containing protein [Chitinophagaceae bacterium]